MDKVGKDGTITVEEAKSIETTLEVVEGMQFDKGYLSPYFVTNAETMEAKLEDAYILIYEKKISSLKDLLPLLEKVAKVGKPLLDHRRGRRRRSAGDPRGQQAARHAQRRAPSRPRASAIAARPCAKTSPSSPAPSSSAKTSASSSRTSNSNDLGRAKSIVVDKENTTIVEGGGKSSDIQGRVNQIRRQIEETTSDYDREKLQERLAKLAGGVAVINVGAATETEMKEKKARVEDALHATRAAVEEGIVPGGGVALLRCLEAIDKRQGLQRRRADRRGHRQARRRVPDPRTGQQRRRGRLRRRPRSQEAQGQRRLQRRRPTSTKTSSRPAWWTRRRSPAPRCRTRRPSPACS